jgi:3-phosphoshikimate 1-carboxyvinyltransferase
MHNSQLLDKYRLSLPLSKSVRARELVLDALNNRCVEIDEENDDIFVLSRALYNAQLSDQSGNSQLSTLNLNASGTALRFLTAYCAVTEGEWVLRGTERLCERPIRPLVDALRGMGAEIEYMEKEGFAPLKIVGGKLNGGRVKLDASLSSQFASALMLISDKVEGGIEIEYEGDVASKSYIRLTENVIEKYRNGVRYSGERVWSSATVWYAVMAVLKKGRFLFEGVSLDSYQPDRAIVEVFEKLGVRTMEVENGVEIESNGVVVDKLVLDCKNMPDAVVYIVVAACLLGVEFEISGVETLRVKESDRIGALINEMRKCGYVLKYDEMGRICWLGERCVLEDRPCIVTYNDHRIAMSMAVVGLAREIEIENREVVNKSYPEFWREFDRVKNIYCK